MMSLCLYTNFLLLHKRLEISFQGAWTWLSDHSIIYSSAREGKSIVSLFRGKLKKTTFYKVVEETLYITRMN